MIRIWILILVGFFAFRIDAAKRPNLIFMLADDLGWADLSCYGNNLHQTTTPVSAIRKGNWKFMEYFEDGRLELFNLKQDPGETRNLSTDRSALARELRADLDAWRKKVGAQLPEVNPV